MTSVKSDNIAETLLQRADVAYTPRSAAGEIARKSSSNTQAELSQTTP